MKAKIGDLVHVWWEDITSTPTPWGSPERIHKELEIGPWLAETVGFVSRVRGKSLSLSPTYCKKQNVFNGLWIIPRGCIRKIVRIK